MSGERSFQRWTGGLAVAAGILALLSLVIGLAGVNYDFEVFSDASSLIAAGTMAADFVRWSFWLNMLGNYLLLVPLALWLLRWLKPLNPPFAQVFTASGLLYLILGATGSAVLAAAWPLLMQRYELADVSQREFLTLAFQVVAAAVEDGLHGVLQNLCGAIWFLGMGALIRSKHGGLGVFTLSIGGFLCLNLIGAIFNIEALSLLGLTANIVLGPLWAIWLGIVLLRDKASAIPTK